MKSTIHYLQSLLAKKHLRLPTPKNSESTADALKLRQLHDYGLPRREYQLIGNSPAWLDQGIADIRHYWGGGVEAAAIPTVG